MRTPGIVGAISSRPLALGTTWPGRGSRENSFGNFVRQRAAGSLQLYSGRLNIRRNTFFGFLERALSSGSRGVDCGLAFVQGAPPLCFLLGKNLGAAFLKCV